MMRDLDAEYDELVDELEEVLQEVGSADCGERLRVVRIRIEDLHREQLGITGRLPLSDRRHGPNALH